jgi:hypothetical protein
MTHFVEPFNRQVISFGHFNSVAVDIIECWFNTFEALDEFFLNPVHRDTTILNKFGVYLRVDHLTTKKSQQHVLELTQAVQPHWPVCVNYSLYVRKQVVDTAEVSH